MQNTDLFAKYPPDDKQWLNQHGQIGKVPDKLLDACLELHRPHHLGLTAPGSFAAVVSAARARCCRVCPALYKTLRMMWWRFVV